MPTLSVPGTRVRLPYIEDYIKDEGRRQKYKTLTANVAGAIALYEFGKRVWAEIETRRAFNIVVESTSPLYGEVQRAIMEMVPPTKLRSVRVNAVSHFDDDILSSLSSPHRGDHGKLSTQNVHQLYDGGNQRLNIGGYRVTVVIEKSGWNDSTYHSSDGWDLGGGPRLKHDRIIISVYSAAAKDAVMHWLGEMAEEAMRRNNPPSFLVANQWNDWNTVASVQLRPIDTVILPDGQLERVVDDLDRFMSMEHEYLRRGLPWHRGYLFYGPPGTGKTSIARALANHFGLDLWYMPLGDMTKDVKLIELVSRIRERGILLLEDIDVFQAARERDHADADGASLSGLLNALDGVATPHGLITIMTTNDIDALDPALIRPGRVDVREKLDYLTDEQLDRLFLSFYEERWPVDQPRRSVDRIEVSPAEVLECMQRAPFLAVDGANHIAAMIQAKYENGTVPQRRSTDHIVQAGR